MSAIPSTLVGFSSTLPDPAPDRGKPVVSILSLGSSDIYPPARLKPDRLRPHNPRPDRPREAPPFKLFPPEPRLTAFFVLSKEPEDAHITGGTRSLDRRLLALDLYPIPDVLPALS